MVSIGILIAVYNEEESVPVLIERIDDLVSLLYENGFDEVKVTIKEGNSTDRTLEKLIENTCSKPCYKVISGPDNGKWSALKIAMRSTPTDIYAVQDGDLEYNPTELAKVVRPILHRECNVCFGSRFLKRGFTKPMKLANYLGNKLMSLTVLLCSRHIITDINTCYKVWDARLTPELNGDGFTGDVELALKLLRRPDVHYKEVPISYKARTTGKKLTALDGFKLWFALFKYLII